jgi:hypothetical protein
MVEVGETYEFQTVTFYYRGTVTHVTPTHVTLREVWKVYDTGPSTSYYGKKGQTEEPLPDGVMLALGMCGQITPWRLVGVK